jgi:hypothetical protein
LLKVIARCHAISHSGWQENNGNAGSGGSTGNFTVDTFDHWINTAGGNWATAINWGNGVPTATLAADVDASGTYTVTISSSDTAYGLLLNAAGAAVSDNTSGALALTDSGGPSNPNGALTINAGTFALAGGGLKAGSISIASGAGLTVSQSYTGSNALAETITDNGSITILKTSTVNFTGAMSGLGSVLVENGATANFSGAVTGAEQFTIENSATAVFTNPINGTGSFTLLNGGILTFDAADSENVTFGAAATGTLTLDAPFTGSVSGLTTSNEIDLEDLSWTKPPKMTATYSGNSSGGTLTVSDGTNSVSIKLIGNYTSAPWTLSKDGSGGTLVIDPPVDGSLMPNATGGVDGSIDFPNILFGAHTTLGYAANDANNGGTLTVTDGIIAQSVALLGQYAASSFVMASDGHGGTLIADPQTTHQPLLANPHT